MRRLLAALLALPLAAGVLAADPPADKATAAELARLAGTWNATRVVIGKRSVELVAAEWSITFKGNRWAMTTPEGKAAGTVKLGLTAKPARLDLTTEKGAFFCVYVSYPVGPAGRNRNPDGRQHTGELGKGRVRAHGGKESLDDPVPARGRDRCEPANAGTRIG